MDYWFPGDEFGYKLTVLAGRERVTGNYLATAVPTKGTVLFSTDRVLDWVDECGDRANAIIVKNDQENSIQHLVADVTQRRQGDSRVLFDESPVGSSQSNGLAERAVQDIEGQLTVLILDLEDKLGFQVDAKAPIMLFLPE